MIKACDCAHYWKRDGCLCSQMFIFKIDVKQYVISFRSLNSHT
ncbi:hypothetical protein MADA3029_740026 [Vibrio nigripulchritudo MADA3029]|nr:hypothetical protein VIBNIMADA3020_1180011 [Vibrio nigripulchritudo MADA3020]CCN54105.1 hypothetical protein VIBNIMADA3021_510027 [Vibrio nigripulchritudo MADA3021]CCN61176.1 hypothetical protein MADA3029_740026 [Vibrio nigripulchritudo MADA3029]